MLHIQSLPGLSPQTRLQWRSGADAPERFSQAQTVVMGESVYVGGGGTWYKIFQYNWRMGVWSTLPECPVKWFGLTQFMGRLTTVGGHDPAGSVTARVHQFVSESQLWQESLPPMPTARYKVTVVARSSSSPKPPAIAVFGGMGDGEVVLNTVEVFCYSTSQWYVADPLPTPLYALTPATVGDIIYLLGGDNNRIFFSSKHCLFVHLDSLINIAISPGTSPSQHGSHWTAIRDTPLARSSASSLRGSVVAIGGNNSAAIHFLNSCGSWVRVRGWDLPAPRSQPAAVCLPSGELMVVGGCLGGSGSETSTLFLATIAD